MDRSAMPEEFPGIDAVAVRLADAFWLFDRALTDDDFHRAFANCHKLRLEVDRVLQAMEKTL